MDILISETKAVEGSVPPSLSTSHSGVITRKPNQSATHAVLFIAELVCSIIALLPFQDILATTSVCHFWHEAVAADQHIQKSLFLRPEEVRQMLVFRRLWSPEFELTFFQYKP